MKLNLLNQAFSFHDFHLTNIENLNDKIILYFDHGLYFEKNGDEQKDYIMTNPRLVLYKSDENISKEDLSGIVGDLIQTFNLDIDPDLGLKEAEKELANSFDINIYKDGTYSQVSLDKFLKLNLEIINESFGYGYMRFAGIVTGYKNPKKWQNASLEIYHNNEAELIYDSLEKL